MLSLRLPTTIRARSRRTLHIPLKLSLKKVKESKGCLKKSWTSITSTYCQIELQLQMRKSKRMRVATVRYKRTLPSLWVCFPLAVTPTTLLPSITTSSTVSTCWVSVVPRCWLRVEFRQTYWGRTSWTAVSITCLTHWRDLLFTRINLIWLRK